MTQENQQHEHLDINVRQRDVFGWSNVAQLLGGLAALAGVYTALTNKDTRMEAEIAQLKLDQVRIEASQKDVRSEIRADLVTITYELRELRSELLKRTAQQR